MGWRNMAVITTLSQLSASRGHQSIIPHFTLLNTSWEYSVFGNITLLMLFEQWGHQCSSEWNNKQGREHVQAAHRLQKKYSMQNAHESVFCVLKCSFCRYMVLVGKLEAIYNIVQHNIYNICMFYIPSLNIIQLYVHFYLGLK